MPISTAYGETPWSTDELAALHGVAGPRAKAKQEALDRLVCQVIAPDYVARRVRADQAAASIAAMVGRIGRLLAGDTARTKQHLTVLVKKAYDRAASARLEQAARRLPAETVPNRALAPSSEGARPDPAWRTSPPASFARRVS